MVNCSKRLRSERRLSLRILHVYVTLQERVVSSTKALLYCGCIDVFRKLIKNEILGHCYLLLGTYCPRVFVCELRRCSVRCRTSLLPHHCLEGVLDGTLSLLSLSPSDCARVILRLDELLHYLGHLREVVPSNFFDESGILS